ncbi:MAG: hypothetical protein JXM69_07020 [Anaerolineae bacterium]|nr:hypothetical protein [Anaerolineae bacterium]
MPLANILQALEVEAQRRMAEIEQTTRAEIERIRTQAQAEAAVVKQKQLTAIEAPLRAEQARILNRAKLGALQIVMGTRENLITAVLEAAAERLAELTATETYADVLRDLTREAVEALGVNGQLRLRVHNGDLTLMNRIAQEMKLAATITDDLEAEAEIENDLGGVVAATPDGRISLLNTPGVRLQRVASLYRAQIAEMMFGEPQEI